MATVVVGDLNELNVCRIETDPDCKETDNPKYVEFDIPTAAKPLRPSSPKWANYVKGVISFFHGGTSVVCLSS